MWQGRCLHNPQLTLSLSYSRRTGNSSKFDHSQTGEDLHNFQWCEWIQLLSTRQRRTSLWFVIIWNRFILTRKVFYPTTNYLMDLAVSRMFKYCRISGKELSLRILKHLRPIQTLPRINDTKEGGIVKKSTKE